MGLILDADIEYLFLFKTQTMEKLASSSFTVEP
jgi:hypothetical protein